jgi:hypothetical protein
MKSNDEKKDDTSSITDEELRTTTDSVLKELLQSSPPVAPDEPSDSEATKSFVVPDYLIAEVAELKEAYPDASEEDLANRLKYY